MWRRGAAPREPVGGPTAPSWELSSLGFHELQHGRLPVGRGSVYGGVAEEKGQQLLLEQ